MSQVQSKPEEQSVPGREDLRLRIETRIRKLERASGNGLWLALVVYAFSGIVRTLASMSRNIKPYLGLMHAAFFTAFYTFYHLSGALQDNFWAVFFAGISVMGLENYYLWAHSSSALNKERALLKSMQEKGAEQ